MTKQTSDVLVVGSGPVGLLTALGLGRAGLQVTVLEREEQLSQSPRAISYLWFVFDLLEGLGILDDVDRAGVRETAGMNLRVFRTGEVITMGFDVLEDLTPRPYVIQLGQDRLAAIALEHLRAYDNVTIRQGVCVTALAQREDHVSVLADGPDGAEELRAKWVVGADGASSTIRRLLGVEFSGMTWDERFVATNIRYDFGAHGFGTTNLLIDPEHGAVIAQIDRTGLYRVTYAESLDLPVETVPERMPRFFEAVLPGDKDYELVHYAPYRMHQRAADTFRLGRVLLAGDAAHTTNPTGGLGLTSGLLDVEVLYPALAAVVRGTAPEEVLDRYAADRRQIFLEVASPQATELKRLVYHSTDPARLAADLAGLRTVAADRELRRGMQLNLARLRTGSLVPATA